MVRVLSTIIATIITMALAIILYPICAVLYVFKVLGTISTHLFNFVNKTIKRLWKDVFDIKGEEQADSTTNAGVNSIPADDLFRLCPKCNAPVKAKNQFCTNCGAKMQ